MRVKPPRGEQLGSSRGNQSKWRQKHKREGNRNARRQDKALIRAEQYDDVSDQHARKFFGHD